MSKSKLKKSKADAPKLWLVYGRADGSGIYRRRLVNPRVWPEEGQRNRRVEKELTDTIAFYSYNNDPIYYLNTPGYKEAVESFRNENKELFQFMDDYLQL